MELAEAIAKHRAHLEESGGWQRVERVRLQSELDMLLQEALVACWRSKVPEKVYLEVVDRLVERSISPHQAVEKLAPCMSQENKMIYGERIRFRHAERSDIPTFVGWLNDPEVTAGDFYLPADVPG